MAITKIAGDILESNLIRTTDLAFTQSTNSSDTILKVDYANKRVGIGLDTPGNFALDVQGNTRVTGNQTITGDLIVQGNTTTLDSTNLEVEDTLTTLEKYVNDLETDLSKPSIFTILKNLYTEASQV